MSQGQLTSYDYFPQEAGLQKNALSHKKMTDAFESYLILFQIEVSSVLHLTQKS